MAQGSVWDSSLWCHHEFLHPSISSGSLLSDSLSCLRNIGTPHVGAGSGWTQFWCQTDSSRRRRLGLPVLQCRHRISSAVRTYSFWKKIAVVVIIKVAITIALPNYQMWLSVWWLDYNPKIILTVFDNEN